jgi:hypothetical protein
MTDLWLILAAFATLTLGALAAAAAHRRLPLATLTLTATLIAALIFAGAVAKRSGAATRGSRCHVTTEHGQPGPDQTCTPGSARPLNRRNTCRSKDRPDLPQAVHDRILRDYGVPNWTGQDGELDHRVPFALGGRTNRSNIWTQPGPIPNTKDKLEFAVWDAVCNDKTMTPRHARRIFFRDWRTAYRHWQRTGNLP